MLVSFAQNQEDILLLRCFGEKRDGFYVDVGASHPVRHSVTQLFYERGWSGVNIEPIPERVAELRRLRPRDLTFRLLAGDRRRTVPLGRERGLGMLSTTQATQSEGAARALQGAWAIMADEVPLSDILAENGIGDIDFLKIDVEGAERAVIEGMDLRAWRPAVVLVEATLPATRIPSHAEWEPLLLGAGYRFAHFDGLNRFYVSAGRADLAAHFATPPGVFDGFARADDLGSPLRNPQHPDHAFTLHLAERLLRAAGAETDEYLAQALGQDLGPAVLDARITAESAVELYALVMGERAPERWVQIMLTRTPPPTGSALLLDLIRSDAFRRRRARATLA